jgi:hypothetical protein
MPLAGNSGESGTQRPLLREAVAGERPDTVLETDEEARALARRLVREARFGALGVLDLADGAPFVSRVALASEPDGHPVMLVSSLSRHTQALRSDPRCSLLVGEPGKGDPLAHPRLSITGEARFLDRESREHATARRRFLARHPKASLYADFADFSFVRIVMARASLNGGFARAYAMSESDLSLRGHPALEGLCEMEAGAVAHMNEDHLDAVALYAEKLAGKEPGNWRMTSFDPEGMDLADGGRVARVPFDPPLQDASELRPRLVALAKAARGEE